MPTYFSEGDTPSAGDIPSRSLQKINSIMFGLLGDVGPGYFPEGSEPEPGDDETRSLQKLNSLFS